MSLIHKKCTIDNKLWIISKLKSNPFSRSNDDRNGGGKIRQRLSRQRPDPTKEREAEAGFGDSEGYGSEI